MGRQLVAPCCTAFLGLVTLTHGGWLTVVGLVTLGLSATAIVLILRGSHA